MPVISVNIEDEQKEWLDKKDLNISKYIRRKIKEDMNKDE